jgi:4-hydroxyphenylacetate 3-hydroxylase, reductase component
LDTSIDSRAFRNALGHYATGVTVVTTMSPQGPLGMTVNSFASVSLEPPLILWSPARKSVRFAAFSDASHFAVHILCDTQRDLAVLFASSGLEPFDGLSYGRGLGGVPLLQDCAACFECKKHAGYDGGDHLILVGEVLRMTDVDKTPLVYHRGGYKDIEPNPQ